ncbi:insulinase family protein [Polynucleobacter paneuropaeus]|uniref:Insulinase family protein n=1 Tax=Polynucleobacter paneuropaeus TaxID=2527775 RepID=A0A9Q2ZV14_9BURK|nr:pitrilysin family protein [Polynucleobacter paneuropaeus]MBT8528839.1 insulinase family protein [Polynucleobacter paneuropaeus]MBT8551498.1 insulinase family protein [Polynucleobacter paneuropaeus]MBT8583521.1 insulinase family protein [Polynucleobacter paneuropaeus]MBT8631257.1 insulinase family protein [Polynucleobacter paneuropaeus]QWD38734.1 insulinase family protein [Polynucleobacter paneuropaeus]
MKYYCQSLVLGAVMSIGLLTSVQAALPIQQLDSYKGAKAYLVQTQSLPMLDIEISIDAGTRYDPASKAGLAIMTAELLDNGIRSAGRNLTEAQIADEIADLGADIKIGVSGERAMILVRCLSRPDIRDRAIQLARLILSSPTYDSVVVNREKQRISAGLLEAETKPDFVLDRRFRKAVYGDYPLGNAVTVKSIAGLSASDLKQFHQQFYRSDRVIVSMVGDVSKSEAQEIMQTLVKDLPQTGSSIPPLPELARSPVENLSEREITIPFDSQQAHIAMGMTAIARNNPDYFPLIVGNYALGGGGFVSRLMNEVREKRGLAYSVFSYFAPGQETGIFQAGLQTKNDQASMALDVMTETISQFIAKGPTQSELDAAKANLINGFPLRIDNNRKLLDNVSSIAWNGLPLNTLDTWTEQVNAVTREQVEIAFQKYLAMDRMKIVVLGAKQ